MSITLYANAPAPVRHAAHKLSDYTRLPIGSDDTDSRWLDIRKDEESHPAIGQQGYRIQSAESSPLVIRALTDEGIANGIFTLLRTLMIENRRDPFSRFWDVAEKPHFSIRTHYVAPYRFGGSYGFPILSPDRWSIDEWMEYIDLMRLCNMTTLTIAPGRVYHPDCPQTERERWRFEVWRDVIAYCHQIGMKCNLITCPSIVPQEVFWNNPELRGSQEGGGYYGWGLVWSKAKDLILDMNRYMFEMLRELDGLEMIYSEAGFLFDEATSANPAKYFDDVTRAYRQLLRDAKCDADYIFWNWIFDVWANAQIPQELVKRFPKYRTLPDDILKVLPRDIGWVDASMLSVIQMFGPEIRRHGNAPLRDGVLLGKEQGFAHVSNCFWYMNPEYSVNMLPHPYIDRAIQEAVYSRDELKPDGVVGYRLAPACRFLGDYTFFRLASDPSLTRDELIAEMARLLCSDTEAQKELTRGVNALEDFWATHEISLLADADAALARAASDGKLPSTQYAADGVTLLHAVVRMSETAVASKERMLLKWELFQQLKEIYVFQGLTTDIVWLPESFRFFSARMDMMIEEYMWYKLSRHDDVDRSIYPKATTKPTQLLWPKGGTWVSGWPGEGLVKHDN